MTAIRTLILVMALAIAAPVLAPDAHAQPNSQDSVFAACETQMKNEFGEAEFKFDKFRRREGNKNFAIGEMTLSDGSKRSIRCMVQRGQVRGVMFRNGNTQGRLDGGFWSNDRPDGAEFVPPAEEETATTEPAETEETETAAAPSDETADPTDTDAAEQPEQEAEPEVQRKFVRVPGATPPEPQTPEQTGTTAPADTEQSDATPPASPEGDAQNAQSTDENTEEKPKPFQPVFRRVN